MPAAMHRITCSLRSALRAESPQFRSSAICCASRNALFYRLWLTFRNICNTQHSLPYRRIGRTAIPYVLHIGLYPLSSFLHLRMLRMLQSYKTLRIKPFATCNKVATSATWATKGVVKRGRVVGPARIDLTSIHGNLPRYSRQSMSPLPRSSQCIVRLGLGIVLYQ